MKRGHLHRHAITLFRRGGFILFGGNAINRVLVSFQVTRGIFGGASPFPEHVEAEMRCIPCLDHSASALLGILHGPSENKLFTHDAHGLHHGSADDRFTAFADQALNKLRGSFLQACRHTNHLPGQHQPPGGGIYQPGFGLSLVRAPVAGADFLCNQLIARFGVGHPQQRLGQTHQGQTFCIRQTKLLKEAFHHALIAATRTGGLDQFQRSTHGCLAQVIG